jgi:hypothetical protein
VTSNLPDPTGAKTVDECLRLVALYAGPYPLSCGWLQCLEPVLPSLAPEVQVAGQTYRRCIAFLVDDDIGPHFVFDDGFDLEEVLLHEAQFAEPLSPVARLWLFAYESWRCEQTQRRRKPWRRAA